MANYGGNIMKKILAAALSVVLMILTSLMISLYKRGTHTTELEGIL